MTRNGLDGFDMVFIANFKLTLSKKYPKAIPLP